VGRLGRGGILPQRDIDRRFRDRLGSRDGENGLAFLAAEFLSGEIVLKGEDRLAVGTDYSKRHGCNTPDRR
jgi:hypothetical protein